jgi:hypothetical protein
MLLLEKEGTLAWTGVAAEHAGWIKGTIELPLDLLDEQSDLIDRVFAFAFDALGLQVVELRIRPPAADGGNRIRPRSI